MTTDITSTFGSGSVALHLDTPFSSDLSDATDRDAFRFWLDPGVYYRLDIIAGTAALDRATVSNAHVQPFDIARFGGRFDPIYLMGPDTGGITYAHVAMPAQASVPGTYTIVLTKVAPVATTTDLADWVNWKPTFSPTADFIDGQGGNDMLSFIELDSVRVNLAIGWLKTGSEVTPSAQSFRDFERFTGTSGDDVFSTSGFFGADSRFIAYDGPGLRLRGLDGDDSLGAGARGRNVLDGGPGRDTADYAFADAFMTYEGRDAPQHGVNVSLLRGTGWTGAARGDVLTSIENLRGSHEDDILTGDRRDNTLAGNGGHDTLIGNAGNDHISGGAMNFNGQMAGYDDFNDVAVFGYDRDQYLIRETVVVRGQGGGDRIIFSERTIVEYIGPGAGDGTDTLTEIEFLQFADQRIALNDLLM